MKSPESTPGRKGDKPHSHVKSARDERSLAETAQIHRIERWPGLLPHLTASQGEELIMRLQAGPGNQVVQRWFIPFWSPIGPTDDQSKAAVSEADQKEFDLLKNKIEDKTVQDYVKHRTEEFGSTEAYNTFAAESDAELDGTKGLRKLIELQGDAQTVYYRWVRKAYHDVGITDVPALIKRGKSDELKDALAAVSQKYGKAFKSGGFNPRPMKSARYRYRLGTISEHALGNAVDIESKKNPILSLKEWRFIEGIAKQTVDRSPKRWKDEPETLWQNIHDLNELFKTNVTTKLQEIEAEAAGKGTVSGKAKQPIDVLFAKYDKLKEFRDGFFTLELELVKALHGQGFKWGATFSNSVDLHHFEL